MAAAFDAKSGTGTNVVNATSVTVSHTCAASATVLFVVVSYWSTSAAQQNLTGITYAGATMTKIGDSGRSNQQDIVEIYFKAGPATGVNNIVASFANSAAGNQGGVQGFSFTGTPTSGGSGTVWADLTVQAGTTSGTTSSVSVPNNTTNDGIVDGVADGAASTPSMGTQTNRTLGAAGNANGEGSGSSYLVPAPSGSQTMNWTHSSTSHSMAAVRVLADTSGAGLPPGLGPNEMMDEPGLNTSAITAMMR